MNRYKASTLLSLMALMLIMSGVTAKAISILLGNGWINIGPDPIGGSYIVGPAGPDVGQLGLGTTPTGLSPGGGDIVTLNPGATASGNFGATIEFESNNNAFINFGTVNGPNNDEGVFRNTGVGFFTEGPMNNQVVINNFVINGGTGNGGGTTIADAGVGFWSQSGISNVGILNNGIINAGSNGSGNSIQGSIGTGVVFYDDNRSLDISGVAMINNGQINGGSNVTDSLIAGNGVVMLSFGNVLNIYFTNSVTGAITAGSNNSTGFIIGSGVVFAASPFGRDVLNGVIFGNAGKISGGFNASHANPAFANGNLNVAGTGVAFWGANGVYNINFNNAGTIAGGSHSLAADLAGESFRDLDFGSADGVGVAIFDANGNSREPGDINGVTMVNSGVISGGSNGSYAFIIGSGVGIVGLGNVLNLNITNTSTGQMLGGNGGLTQGGIQGSAVVGTGLGIAAGVIGGNFSINSVSISNAGLMAGGSGNTNGDIAGVGLGIWSGNGVYNVGILNTNTIIGGNNNTSGNRAAIIGAGIGITDANFNLANINGVVIANTGIVQGGDNNHDAPVTNSMAGVGIGVVGLADVSNVIIVNTGTAAGGNGNFNASFRGDGIVVSGSSGSNNTIYNTGLVLGGNAAPGGSPGIGINLKASNSTITNWGVVQVGSGISNAQTAGFPAVGIKVLGSNNVINLNGHSSVVGPLMVNPANPSGPLINGPATIEGVNGGVNNHVNLNFTGLSPAAILALTGTLASQGYPATNNFTGTFTVRGVTYYIDPLILGVNVTSYQVQGFPNPNLVALGSSLDSIPVNPTGPLLGLYNAIDMSGNVPAAMEQLSPQMYQIYGDIAQATTNFMSLEIDHRLNNLRDGSETIDTMGLGGETTAGFSKDGKNVVVPDKEALEKRWGFFGSGQGIFSTIAGHGGNLSDAGFDTTSLLLGVDGKINDRWVVGLLFNYDYTSADLDNQGSHANVETYGGGVYTGYHNGNWYGNGLAAYGHNSYDSTRTILIPGFNQVAAGQTDGNQYSVNLDGGYDFHVCDHLTVGPLAGLEYVHLDVDGFNESGAGPANLSVGSQSMDSLRSRIGFHMDYRRQIGKEIAFATEIRAAWQHEFLDDSRGIDGNFIGAGLTPFTVQTTDPQRDSVLAGVGVNFTVRDTMTVFFDYDVQAGQQSYIEHSVKGGLKFSF